MFSVKTSDRARFFVLKNIRKLKYLEDADIG